jgi:hypothetical protein
MQGIVSRSKMRFWRFHCIAGNFLMIRWRILNFKIVVLILKFKKYGVRPVLVFLRWKPGCQTKLKKCNIFVILQKIFYFNYLLQFPKNLEICFCREKNPLRWQPFFGPFVYILLEDLPFGEIFLPYGDKNLSVYQYLSITSTGLWTKRRPLGILFEF